MFKRNTAGFVITCPEGDSVLHEGLAQVPYTSSIEGWVRKCFPDAEYVQSAAKAIAAPDLGLQGLQVIQAPKGAGKSKAIRAAVAALPPDTSVVQVTFRRTLAWSSNEMMGAGATLYSNVPGTTINAKHHPRLTIVVNSIGRILGSYDVVVIDEVVSVLDMLSGPLLAPDVKVEAVATLAGLIAQARCVVIADAMLDAAAVDFVRKCRSGAPLLFGDARRGDELFLVVDYVSRLHGDYTYIAHASSATWSRELNQALLEGKRVVVPCMTKKMANEVAAQFAERFPTRCYTADTDPEVLAAHMLDIHAHWGGDVRVLVYSPVVTAGCSFELPHFDQVFFYGCAGLGSVRSAAQMIARVRDVADKRVHVYLANAQNYSPMQARPLALCTHIAPTRQKFFMHLLQLLEVYRDQEDAQAIHAFPYYFWSLVVHSGARIGYLKEALQPLVPKQLLFGSGGAGAGAGGGSGVVSAETSSTAMDDDATPAPPIVPVLDPWQEMGHRGYRETSYLHDWDAEVPRFLPLRARRLPADTSLLQRVHMVHPRHWQGAGLVPPLVIASQSPLFESDKVLGGGGGSGGSGSDPDPASDLAAQIGSSLHTRLWLGIVAQKSFRKSLMDLSMKTSTLPAGPPRVSTTRYFVPRVALEYPSSPFVADPEVKARIFGAIKKFVAAEKAGCVFEVLGDAWVIAAAETAVLSGSHLTKDHLGGLELPPTPTYMVVKIGDIMSSVLLTQQLVLVNWCAGKRKEKEGGSVIIDYLCMDRHGRWHIVLCRTTGGSLDTHVASDYAKACAMAAIADVGLATVTILYFADNRKVVLELPLGADDGPETVAADLARRREFKRVLTETLEVPGWSPARDPLVSWDQVALWLRTAIANFLRLVPEDIVLDEARVMGVADDWLRRDDATADATPDTDCGPGPGLETEPPPDPHAHLKVLYEGVLTRGFVVYYWNARPWGIPIRWVV